ncbi:MAG TPA: glycosyl hydrolase [Blastocatellia bacterium]|nr:glycosyl hydrolase [Blastocatellia bacterium]
MINHLPAGLRLVAVPVLLIALGLLATLGAPQESVALEDGFQNPPRSSGIRCWWWWLNGNVTKEGLTRDLEEMKAKGFSGASIFDAGGAEQRGNRQVPEGPMFGTPEWRELFKHAVREADRLGLVLSLNIQSGWNLGGPDVTPAEATKHLTWSEVRVKGPVAYRERLPPPPIHDGFYREIAALAFGAKAPAAKPPIRDLTFKAAFKEVSMSAPDTRYLLNDVAAQPGEEDARLKEIVHLTDKLGPDGTLQWNVPAGEWVIMRFGYTTSGAQVSTSSGKWKGRVIDHLGEQYFLRYWKTHVEPLLEDVRPMVGRTLKYLQTDSWELDGINWTDNFAAEFRRRRGYDVISYLPVVAGKIVESRDQSNRFLADFRKTISDLISDRHYRVFAEQARRYGMGIQPESAGPHAGPFDGLKNYGHSEIPMGEFWVPSPHRPTPERRYFVKMAASAAHIYNRRLVGAESFTSIGPHWDDTLWSSQKPSFDHEVCSGLNLVLLHTFTASPKEMGLPGQEYFAGTHFNPNVTWWEQAGEPIRYINRCQFMMQRGKFVADALYYYGDHVPNIARLKEDDPAKVLPGYDYDLINEEVLLTRLSVRDGRLTLPDGQTYRLLALPDHQVLSLAALRKVRDLVKNGATVLGPKPERTVSLVGYPKSEIELQQLAGELWGAGDSGEHRAGRGRVIWGKTAREVLQSDRVAPDFEAQSRAGGRAAFDYIHHQLGEIDYYFVSNQDRQPQQIDGAFRVSGKQPELWDPLTGKIREARAFTQADGRTILPLEFDPYGSVFVVFRKPISPTRNGEARSNFPSYEPVAAIEGAWQVRFDPKWGGPESAIFERLVSWTTRPEDGIRFYSGRATYRIEFDLNQQVAASARLALGLGEIRDVGIARVRLNGKDLGVTWTPPFRMELGPGLIQPRNVLEVEVINSWRNRLVGDRDLPEDRRFTRTNVTIRKEWPLLDSGLLGPVQIFSVKD